MKDKRLYVVDLKDYLFEKVVLYVCRDDDYEDIYKGEVKDIPSEMLDYEVRLIGAKRKGILDISVRVR